MTPRGAARSLPPMRCPRCQRDSKDGAVFCAGCCAPLGLRPEPTARLLDTPVPLDRRGGAREPAEPPRIELDRDRDDTRRAVRSAEPLRRPGPLLPPRTAPGPGAAPLLDTERSHWDLRAVAPGGAEPVPPPARAERSPAARETDSWRRIAAPPPDEWPFPEEEGWSRLAAAPPPAPLRPTARRLPSRPAVAGGAAGPGVGDELPDVDVDALEIHLRRPAGWRRAAAWLVDGVPFAVFLGWAWKALHDGIPEKVGAMHGAGRYVELAFDDGGAMAGPLLAALTILWFVYATLSHALAGATLGKWILGLRVVGQDGRRPSLRRSAARSTLALASAALLGLGLLLALFARSGRALHDLSAGTWVVEAP